MEQGLTFIGLVVILMVMMFIIESPILFLITFVIGCTYHIIRGRIKGWKLPQNIRDTHMWKK